MDRARRPHDLLRRSGWDCQFDSAKRDCANRSGCCHRGSSRLHICQRMPRIASSVRVPGLADMAFSGKYRSVDREKPRGRVSVPHRGSSCGTIGLDIIDTSAIFETICEPDADSFSSVNASGRVGLHCARVSQNLWSVFRTTTEDCNVANVPRRRADVAGRDRSYARRFRHKVSVMLHYRPGYCPYTHHHQFLMPRGLMQIDLAKVLQAWSMYFQEWRCPANWP